MGSDRDRKNGNEGKNEITKEKRPYTLDRTAKGRDGFRFVFRDVGQTIRIEDYAKIKISRRTRGGVGNTMSYTSTVFKKMKEKILAQGRSEFMEGRYIYGDLFVMLCAAHKIKINKLTKARLQYMNEIDVSIRTIRHKNARGDYKRREFEGTFLVIEKIVYYTNVRMTQTKPRHISKYELANNSDYTLLVEYLVNREWKRYATLPRGAYQTIIGEDIDNLYRISRMNEPCFSGCYLVGMLDAGQATLREMTIDQWERKYKSNAIHMKLKPIADRVLILPDEADSKTKGGILIPATAQETPARGRVIAVGPGIDGNIMTVQVDDTVLYGRYAGQEMEHDGIKYRIMREPEIFIVIDSND